MFVYNVTLNVNYDVVDEWLQWMMEVHIPQVLATGCFVSNKIFRVLADEDSGGKTYSIQYYFNSMDDFNVYEEKYAIALRSETTKLFKDKFVAFRTLLEVIKD
jgi:hypothetical protein